MSLTVEKVLEAQLHIGSLKNESSPKTRTFWTDITNGVVVLDPQKIAKHLDQAKDKIQQAIKAKKEILVVCDKSMYTEELVALAEKHGFHYLNDKIPGGFVTNFETLIGRISTLNDRLRFLESEDFARLTKKEQVMNQRAVRKIEKIYGGVRNLRKKPDLVVVIDGAMMTNFLNEVSKSKLDNIVFSSTDFAQWWSEDDIVVANMKSYKSIDFIMSHIFTS